MKNISYGTNVESTQEMVGMFNVYRTFSSEVPVSIALSYLDYAGHLDINVENPHVLLTYEVESLGYIAICNNHPLLDTVTAVFLHFRGKNERFPKAGGAGIFSFINLSHLESSFSLTEITQYSDMPLRELQFTLYGGYLSSELFLMKNS